MSEPFEVVGGFLLHIIISNNIGRKEKMAAEFKKKKRKKKLQYARLRYS